MLHLQGVEQEASEETQGEKEWSPDVDVEISDTKDT